MLSGECILSTVAHAYQTEVTSALSHGRSALQVIAYMYICTVIIPYNIILIIVPISIAPSVRSSEEGIAWAECFSRQRMGSRDAGCRLGDGAG
jgi:hypothetical protein